MDRSRRRARIAAGLREAQRDWEQRGAEGRAKVLARFAVWLGEHRDEIEPLLITETGKSATDAAQEVPMLIMIASYYIKTMEKALAPETRPAPLPFLAVKKIAVHYRPRAVVGIIAPWNFPVANAMMDALGALAAGCAVLLKPSERTPLTAELLVRGWRESGAPAVFAMAQGAREVVRGRHRRRGLHPVHRFDRHGREGDGTRRPAAHPGQPGTRRQGSDDRAARTPTSTWPRTPRCGARMFNAGQMCVSVERVYVLESVYDQFVAAVVRDVQALEGRGGRGPPLRRADRREPGRGHRASRRRRAGQGRQGTDRW